MIKVLLFIALLEADGSVRHESIAKVRNEGVCQLIANDLNTHQGEKGEVTLYFYCDTGTEL